jgi:hypothetical protein
MSGRVPPSSRARAFRSTRTEAQRAASRFERFTGHDAEEIGRVEIPALPKVAAVIGTCTAVCYETVRDGRIENYIHEFSQAAAPMLAVSPDGKQLLLVGGKYTFTERGIVDNARKRK